MAIFAKDPAATVDYAIDWSAGYLTGQTIIESRWNVLPAEAGAVTIVAASIGPGQTVATVSGGRVGQIYRITNSVRFSDSRNDQRSLVLRVEER